MARNIRYGTDWLLKAHYRQNAYSGAGNALVVQVGDAEVDHSLWWGRPEEQPSGGAPGEQSWRPAWTIDANSRGGADQAGSAAAALAAASLVFRVPGFSQVRTQRRVPWLLVLLVQCQAVSALTSGWPCTWCAPPPPPRAPAGPGLAGAHAAGHVEAPLWRPRVRVGLVHGRPGARRRLALPERLVLLPRGAPLVSVAKLLLRHCPLLLPLLLLSSPDVHNLSRAHIRTGS